MPGPLPAPVPHGAAEDMGELTELIRLYQWFKAFEERAEALEAQGLRPSEAEMREFHRLRADFLRHARRAEDAAQPPTRAASGAADERDRADVRDQADVRDRSEGWDQAAGAG